MHTAYAAYELSPVQDLRICSLILALNIPIQRPYYKHWGPIHLIQMLRHVIFGGDLGSVKLTFFFLMMRFGWLWFNALFYMEIKIHNVFQLLSSTLITDLDKKNWPIKAAHMAISIKVEEWVLNSKQGEWDYTWPSLSWWRVKREKRREMFATERNLPTIYNF